MVRRTRSFSLDPGADGELVWLNESLVLRADALDNHTHTSWDARRIPPMDYYGSTPWWTGVGCTNFSAYWMAAVRYWHWGPGNAHTTGGSRTLPGSYDIALAFSRDGNTWSFIGDRQSWARVRGTSALLCWSASQSTAAHPRHCCMVAPRSLCPPGPFRMHVAEPQPRPY